MKEEKQNSTIDIPMLMFTICPLSVFGHPHIMKLTEL